MKVQAYRLIAFSVFPILMIFFQNCSGTFRPNVLNSIELPSDSSSTSFMTEKIGSREFPVDPSDSLLANHTYYLNIPARPNATNQSLALTWTLNSSPENACQLVATNDSGRSQALTCSVAAQIRIEIRDGADASGRIVINKGVIQNEELRIDGRSLYSTNCQACHTALETSTINGRTAAQIALALVHVPTMASQPVLQKLRPIEIHAIVAALTPEMTPPSGTPSTTPTPAETASPSPTPTPSLALGTSLYASKCAACHGPVGTSTKIGRSAAQIKAAIAAQPQMQSLLSLTDAEINAIATALQPIAPIEKAAIKRKGRMVSRYYLADVFREVFGNPTFSIDTAIKPVLYKPTIFGTACDVNSSYAAQDCGAILSGTGGDLLLESTTIRQLTKLKACEDILGSNYTIYTAAGLVNGMSTATAPKELTDEMLPEIYALFFRMRSMTPAELKGYSAMVKALKAKTPAVTTVDVWRAVLLAVCESPEWEVL